MTQNNDLINETNHWQAVNKCYNYYPTVRHRWNYILQQLRKYYSPSKKINSIFDYGCGNGELLLKISDFFSLNPKQLYGCDIAEEVLKTTREKISATSTQFSLVPPTTGLFSIIICSEVIEHTAGYQNIIDWIGNHLEPGGYTILSTQTGKIYPCDKYTGHVNHFEIEQLYACLAKANLMVINIRRWGFPFYSLQKILTRLKFDNIKERFLEGDLSITKILTYNLAYLAHCFNIFNYGPQIYAVATKKNIKE